jgi:hypothetical protein
MHPQPLICVRDVEASSRWYQRLLGCESDHGGPQYERLVSNGHLILQLHAWDIEHHHGVAHLLMGSVTEAALVCATSPRPLAQARTFVAQMRSMLEGLRVEHTRARHTANRDRTTR